MLRRIPRLPGLPFGGRTELLLLFGAAFFAGQHEQGRHEQPHPLCLICWLNRIAPEPETSGPSGPAEPSGDSGPGEPPEQAG